jgi:hypothetical protein
LIENFVAPKLAQISENVRRIEADADKAEVAAAVWQSFRQYQGTGLSGASVTRHIIPALRNVMGSTPALDPGVRQSVEAKLKQLEAAVSALKPSGTGSSSPTHPAAPIPTTTATAVAPTQAGPGSTTSGQAPGAAVKQFFNVFKIGGSSATKS